MAKDYAKKTKNSKAASRGVSKKRKPAPTNQSTPALWLVAGLTIGLFCGGLYFIKQHQMYRANSHLVKADANNTAIKTAKMKIAKQPEFDFYTILPKEKVWEPGSKTAASQANSNSTTAATPSTNYVLQVAAFKDFSAADSLKAKLILEGYPANVDAKPVNGWTRVWLGPFTSQQAVENAQVKIAESDKLNGLIVPVSG